MIAPTLDGYVSRSGIHVLVWCEHCRKDHAHGHHCGGSPNCNLPAIPRSGQICTCPLGNGNGHRVAHCHDPESPYDRTGYIIREVGYASGEYLKRLHHERKPTTLYRFFNSDGQLLYVGISSNPGSRWKQHRADKPWWAEVANVTLEHFENRNAALEAEREAIATERPQHNVVHNKPLRTRPEKVAYLKPRGWKRISSNGAQSWRSPAWPLDRTSYTLAAAVNAAQNRGLSLPAWGSRAIDMPDNCRACRDDYYEHGGESYYQENGGHGYLPYLWREGKAEYSCQRGHHWPCWWGHGASGEAPENRGHRYAWAELDIAKGVIAA